MARPQLLLLGDSITELGSNWQLDGWICLLLHRFNRAADVVQRGMGGYTTQWFMDLVMPTLARDLETTLHPSLITLWLGANDAALLGGPSSDQHVPLDRYKANLHAMVTVFKAKAPEAKILLITPPAVDEDVRRALNDGALDRSNAAAGAYAAAYVQVASEAGVLALDPHTRFNALAKAEWASLLVDGLHLSRAGNHFFERELTSTIAHAFPDLQSRLEAVEFPLWVPPNATARVKMFATADARLGTTVAGVFSASPALLPTVVESNGFSTGLVVCVVVGLLLVLGRRWVGRRQARSAERARLLHDPELPSASKLVSLAV